MENARMIRDMIGFYHSSTHDVVHFLKVYAYARTIGKLTGLDEQAQRILEIAAITHDIACPLCREKYGRADGHLQEQESEPILRGFLAEYNLPEPILNRVLFLVCHHHTITGVDGLDWRILLEADFLVNAQENHMSPQQMESAKAVFFQTSAGKEILTGLIQAANQP